MGRKKKKRTLRCIKQRALLTENKEIKLPSLSLCFTSNYVFKDWPTWAGKAEMGREEECSRPISYHYGPVDISLSLSDSQLWFPLAIFCSCTKRGFHHGPIKKGPKCPHKPSLIRKQRCVRPCRSSPIHVCSLKAFRYAIILFPRRLPLSACCKYTILYVEVSGMRGWWRAGPVIFLQL